MVQYTRFPRSDAGPDEGSKATPRSRRAAAPAYARPRPGAEDATGAGREAAPRPARNEAPGRDRGAARGGPRPGEVAPSDEPAPHLPLPITLLVISFFLPFSFGIGSLHMTPVRVILLAMIVPLGISWISGRCGRIRAADLWFLACCLWMIPSILNYGGFGQIQYIGITIIELFGAYLMARRYVRTEANFRGLVRLLRLIALVLLPGAILESLTGMRIYNAIFDPFFRTFPWANYGTRMGMFRAQTVFEHPILYGVCVAVIFGPSYAEARNHASRFGAFLGGLPSIGATFFSLSSGAILALVIQMLLMAWDRTMRHVDRHWLILAGIVSFCWVTVDLLSNRTPFEVFISYLTFNAGTSYARVLIFEFGMDNVMAHPLFGIGLGDWVRPDWMHHGSVDNFWLVFAMRYGIPGFVTIAGAYFASLAGLMRARPASETARRHRNGLVYALIGLGIALCTVHVWSGSFTLAMFLLGAGAWAADVPQEDAPRTAGATGRPAAPREGAAAAGALGGRAGLSGGATASARATASGRRASSGTPGTAVRT